MADGQIQSLEYFEFERTGIMEFEINEFALPRFNCRQLTVIIVSKRLTKNLPTDILLLELETARKWTSFCAVLLNQSLSHQVR